MNRPLNHSAACPLGSKAGAATPVAASATPTAFDGRKVRRARKAGRCVSYRAAEAGNAPECLRLIKVGDQYVEGEIDPYLAGGFGHERVCLACAKAGHA